MKGEGFYDRHSSAQAAAIGQVLEWFAEGAAAVPLPPSPRPIVVLDLGSSEGRNALQSMGIAVEALRHRTAQPIQTVYSDLPTNNFNQLFANLAAAGNADWQEAYASATAGSFYGPLLPEASVQLATCFNSLLWLDRLPDVGVPDFVCYRRPLPTGPAVPAATAEAFAARAADDLVRFLAARARELVPGGKLVLATPADDDRGRCCDGLYDALNDACLDLVAAGRIERARYERFLIPVYFRTLPGPAEGGFAGPRALRRGSCRDAGGADAVRRGVSPHRRHRRACRGIHRLPPGLHGASRPRGAAWARNARRGHRCTLRPHSRARAE
jgi:hypothetical protein